MKTLLCEAEKLSILCATSIIVELLGTKSRLPVSYEADMTLTTLRTRVGRIYGPTVKKILLMNMQGRPLQGKTVRQAGLSAGDHMQAVAL